MMKRAITTLVIASMTAACFGTGPEPTAPTEATILLALELHPLKSPDDGPCLSGRFLGNVAIGSDFGYAVTHTFLSSCNGGQGDPNQPLSSLVFQFSKQGAGAEEIGTAGQTQEGGGPRPRIAAQGAEAVWVFGQSGMSGLTVSSKSGTIGGSIMGDNAAGIVVDETRTYVGTGPSQGGAFNPLDPKFPCCGNGGSGQPGQNGFVQLTHMAPTTAMNMPVAPRFLCFQMKDCLVQNTDTLYYTTHAEPPGPQPVIIKSQPKNLTAGEQIGALPPPPCSTCAPEVIPTGLVADDTHVVWSTSLDFTKFTSDLRDPPPAACSIKVTTVAAPRQERELLSTTKFSCLDVALDGNFVYFTIIQLDPGDFNSVLRNVGIGRIALDTGNFESIATGISGPEAGPRQVFIDGDGIIAVAPFVIARYAKSALDGRHDITP